MHHKFFSCLAVKKRNAKKPALVIQPIDQIERGIIKENPVLCLPERIILTLHPFFAKQIRFFGRTSTGVYRNAASLSDVINIKRIRIILKQVQLLLPIQALTKQTSGIRSGKSMQQPVKRSCPGIIAYKSRMGMIHQIKDVLILRHAAKRRLIVRVFQNPVCIAVRVQFQKLRRAINRQIQFFVPDNAIFAKRMVIRMIAKVQFPDINRLHRFLVQIKNRNIRTQQRDHVQPPANLHSRFIMIKRRPVCHTINMQL